MYVSVLFTGLVMGKQVVNLAGVQDLETIWTGEIETVYVINNVQDMVTVASTLLILMLQNNAEGLPHSPVLIYDSLVVST